MVQVFLNLAPAPASLCSEVRVEKVAYEIRRKYVMTCGRRSRNMREGKKNPHNEVEEFEIVFTRRTSASKNS